MSKFINNTKFTATAAFGAAALFSMLAFGGTAEAKSVLSCQGGTSKKVVDCCEKLVKENGRPVWMVQSGMTCKKIAVCRGGANLLAVAAVVPNRCYAHVLEVKDYGGEKPGDPPGRPSRSTSPNNPN